MLKFFRIIKARPSKAKQLRVPSGARQSLTADHIAVAMHATTTMADGSIGNPLVQAHVESSASFMDTIGVLSDLRQDLEAVEQSLTVWQKQPELQYYFDMPSIARDSTNFASMCALCTKMVNEGALPGGSTFVPSQSESSLVRELCSAGVLVGCESSGGWAL
eukprot:2392847-Alexandrium_andersonii.AAC.1